MKGRKERGERAVGNVVVYTYLGVFVGVDWCLRRAWEWGGGGIVIPWFGLFGAVMSYFFRAQAVDNARCMVYDTDVSS